MKISAPFSTVSIVVPVYNGGNQFHQCLKSIAQASPAADEVIIVADGDSDGSGQLAQELGLKVIGIPQSQGPATARNLGAKEAYGDILFFVDADVEIHADAIGKVKMFFQDHPDFVALIGSYDDAPAAGNFLSQYKNLFHHYTHQTGSEEASTFWGACGAIKRNIFIEMDGFDEIYRRPCIEDIELGYRLKQAGYRIKLCKQIQVKHLKRWGVISLLRADFFYRAIPWTALILRDRRLVNDLNLSWTNRVSIILVYLFLGSLVVAGWWLPALFISILLMMVLFQINRAVYQFFYRQRGSLFAFGVIPWHWLYYFYSGLAFCIGLIRHYFSLLKPQHPHK